MKLSLMGRVAMATLASLALGLGMSACGGGTIGFMWVLGDQYNQITGYKIDDYTGNLTQIIGSPFSSNGTNPVSIVVKPGGRYVYVINTGVGGSRPTAVASGKETSGGIAVYSVGGDGVLTYQQTYQTQGNSPQWAQMDSSGSYLYVLDKYSPDPKQYSAPADTGSISAYSVDGDTGRLTLLTNSAVLDGAGNPTTFFNVGVAPTMMKVAGTCLFTLDSADNTIFPYVFGGGGQLTISTTGTIPTSFGSLTSINGNSSNIYLTTAGSPGAIVPYSVSGTCNLVVATGGSVQNITGTSNPTYSLVDNQNKYLYVLNQSTTISTGGTTTPYSSISAFVISPQLTAIPGSPYIVGAGPQCIVEDPSGQYVYISNRDGTVTGEILNPTTGELSTLSRGSTFTASGLGSCLAVSGNVD